MGEVIAENELARHIRYRHKIVSAAWSSAENLWTLDVLRTDTDEKLRFTCNFLWMCQGYYRHAEGYTPEWKDMELFHGTIVHPQTWPKDLDYRDKNVLVNGSGATTATVVPAIAAETRHTTVLQRSPTYFYPAPNKNELADTLRELDIDETWVHEIVRRKILHDQEVLTKLCLEHGDLAKEELLKGVRAYLPDDYVQEHFTPRYRPWQQRIALVPDGDLFAALREGSASIVTDTIATFTEHGIRVGSGEEIPADVVITATGFNLSVFGDIAFSIDDEPVDFTERVTWRGMMISGVPNMAYMFGYFRHSWTLRIDLVADVVARLFETMRAKGAVVVTPTLRPTEADMPKRAWSDPENFNAGYVLRSQHLLYKQGDREPWTHMMEHDQEREVLPKADLDDGTLVYR
jgi:cation diffusion facilitator CzcD-associated flavoprotein CzcO